MLYKIEKSTNRYQLFLSKKAGLKFKKSFTSLAEVDWFLEAYLRHACIHCLQKSWIYKTRLSGGLHGGYNRMGKGGWVEKGSKVYCPECRSEYVVEYDGWKLSLKNNSERLSPCHSIESFDQ